MNSRLQNIHTRILCDMERRKETVEFVGNRKQKNVSSMEYTVCNMGRVEVICWV